MIQDLASSATLTALLAARERATGFATRERGLRSNLVAYTSSQAHSSVEKAAMIADLGRGNLRPIEVMRLSPCVPTLWPGQSPKTGQPV
ncbi:MAG TPA: PLP-dependent decarboxylase [Caldilineae bacterium]|nr:PLP-dependent decarboxylase [Caldilineae bacterium]